MATPQDDWRNRYEDGDVKNVVNTVEVEVEVEVESTTVCEVELAKSQPNLAYDRLGVLVATPLVSPRYLRPRQYSAVGDATQATNPRQFGRCWQSVLHERTKSSCPDCFCSKNSLAAGFVKVENRRPLVDAPTGPENTSLNCSSASTAGVPDTCNDDRK